MDQRLVAVVMGGFLLCVAQGARGQALPEGKGKAEFLKSCTTCHRGDVATGVRKTPDEWKKSVADMVSRGANASPEEMESIVGYLSANFGKEAAGQAAAPSALSKAEVELVTGVIADNGCLICHRIEAQGMYTGPSLNGVGGRKTPEQIRTAIVHPHATLDPKNSLAKLTTSGGKTIVARIMSQDERSVKVIDSATGEIGTYVKAELKEFTVIDTNPMPSYEKRIAPEDLPLLVRYLGSLPSLD